MLALLLALLVGEAEARPPAVSVEVTDVTDVTVAKGKMRFVLVAEVSRPRGLPLRLREVDYRLKVNKTEVMADHLDLDGLRVAQGAPQTVRVPCEIGLDEVAGAGLQSLLGGSLQVRLAGEARARVLIVPFTVPFQTRLVDLRR
jgi:hypothetical protein